ncbi:MAG: class I SAM-dependent methyltransferase [Phycisphaerales bacterium]|nr:class I SAM-dependent methyltransferase [Phycisphaerales bacterium]
MPVNPPVPAFDHCAGDYARHRPDYPSAVFELLNRATDALPSRRAADLGAGTGIFSRRLAQHGWTVFAVEPSRTLLQHVRPPGHSTHDGCIHLVGGVAEHPPLRDGAAALVTAAQAFHWFNPPYALAEIARILTPGGVLALIWNNRDASRCPFTDAFESLVARYNPSYDREYRQQDWPGKIAASGRFDPAQYERIDHLWPQDADAFVGFTRSASYIRNVLSRDARGRFENDLRALIRQHFGNEPFAIPLRTDIWIARRTP